jgi:hypothetical protein
MRHAETRTRIARSRVQRANHETNAPQYLPGAGLALQIYLRGRMADFPVQVTSLHLQHATTATLAIGLRVTPF